MRVLERLFCSYVQSLWVIFLVGRSGAPAEERPKPPDNSGEACRCLVPERAILPGW